MGDVVCPGCGGENVVRNGVTRHGKQNFRCPDCGRQFVEHPAGRIPAEVRRIVDRMLDAEHDVAAIAEITEVSREWIYNRKRRDRQSNQR